MKKTLWILSISLVLSSCSSEPTVRRADSGRAPSSTCEETQLNQECFVGGSRETEEELFRVFAQQIREIMDRQAKSHNGGQVLRAVHAKGHACLSGELKVYDQTDSRTRYGVFAEPGKEWPVEVRFSNGVGWKRADADPDVRGLAIKLMGVPGEKLGPNETSTQDFIMINSPIPLGANTADFMKFAEANSRGKLDLAKYLLENIEKKISNHSEPVAIDALPGPTPPSSVTRLGFWSGSPYRLGPDQAIKFQVQPRTCDFETKKIIGGAPSWSPPRLAHKNYLRADLVERAKTGICYEFLIQFQTDPKKTPIENTLIEWKESDAPAVPVGLLLLPPQDFDPNQQSSACDQLSFNPWHSLEAHRPLGNTNRSRRIIYETSREKRGGDSHEPHPESK